MLYRQYLSKITVNQSYERKHLLPPLGHRHVTLCNSQLSSRDHTRNTLLLKKRMIYIYIYNGTIMVKKINRQVWWTH